MAEFPKAGVSLEDTLAALQEPRRTSALVQVRDVRVFRIDVEPWVPVPVEDARAGTLRPESGARFAIVASFNCQSRTNRQRIYGEKTGWYVLTDGRLSAWEHPWFGDACWAFDSFQPARGDAVADEKRVVAWIEKNAPRSAVHARQIYGKGVAYARVGRLDDARASLAAGDAAFESTTDDKIYMKGGTDQAYTADREALRGGTREALVRAIAEAEAKAAGKPAAAP